ncbi:hypothetical protein OMY_02254 [Enterococcus sulfureus ATCC 49903]|uniref:Uncharacterized protein n=1 Tax=Enterococcus sulfureus ATCC 49903 TaxID=1140003 RepID=S0KK60_9ENTE|nr:hypothetical protein [Enterococcus sulfureus]EOT45107.1 hypothetical protein OMY_02254 [Enterococcus sulfureus ATCC 49903]EOT82635.1 hypothetical protein I573_02250 [Enterococcus sulfureus ATCC 49903]
MKKFSILFISSLLLSVVVVPSVSVFADEYNAPVTKANISTSSKLTNSDLTYLKNLGLTDLDINQSLNRSEKNVDLLNGYVVSKQRGKWSAAAKILVKNYNKLPGWIKGVVGYGAANSLAKTLETFNGTLTDGLTIGLEGLGFSPGVARYFANGIAWALF